MKNNFFIPKKIEERKNEFLKYEKDLLEKFSKISHKLNFRVCEKIRFTSSISFVENYYIENKTTDHLINIVICNEVEITPEEFKIFMNWSDSLIYYLPNCIDVRIRNYVFTNLKINTIKYNDTDLSFIMDCTCKTFTIV